MHDHLSRKILEKWREITSVQLGKMLSAAQLLERTTAHVTIHVHGETHAPLRIDVSFHHFKCLMQNILKNHNRDVIRHLNSYRKYT